VGKYVINLALFFLIETVMRAAGAILLVSGFLLCVSVAWAAIGFFAMGFGLIFLLVDEERKKRTALHLENATIRPDPIMAPPSSRGQVRQDEAPSETDQWGSLVESDQELSRLVRILTPFGQKYVDQLAGAYLAFNNKDFLPTILNLVKASARRDANLIAAGEMNPNNSIATPTDPGPIPFGKFVTLTTSDGFSKGREIDQSPQQSLASSQKSEGIAVREGITTEAVTPVQTPAHEMSPFEFANLKGLLEKINDREDLNVRQGLFDAELASHEKLRYCVHPQPEGDGKL
jgi:hypothetical protein